MFYNTSLDANAILNVFVVVFSLSLYNSLVCKVKKLQLFIDSILYE